MMLLVSDIVLVDQMWVIEERMRMVSSIEFQIPIESNSLKAIPLLNLLHQNLFVIKLASSMEVQ